MIRRNLLLLFCLLVIFFVYRNWIFNFQVLASGDWPYLFRETVQKFTFIPKIDFLWLAPYYQWTSKLSIGYLNISWSLYERIFWFWAFLVVSFFSSFYFSKVLLGKSGFNFLSVLIFLTNTYILMIVGGGQMGFALGYALSPAIFAFFIAILKSREGGKKTWILFPFLSSILLMFDPRIFFLVTLMEILYVILISPKNNKYFYFAVSYIIAAIVNFYWIIPLIFHKTNVDSSYFNASSLSFFSFAHFEDAFSLLHPNWPENIFGKSYFLRPEFLILPFLAFASLFFVSRKKEFKKEIVYFALLSIIGIFLAKGTQAPFGSVYVFLFNHIPGFSLFRDPTKFYVLIAISYMMLVPFALEQFSKIEAIKKNKIQLLVPLVFILFWIITIRQAVAGQLSGTFQTHYVPVDYVQLKDFLFADKDYSRVLWIPSRDTFSFYSDTHPFLEASQLFGVINKNTIKDIFQKPQYLAVLKKQEIKYVILDEDIEGKLFVDDGKYSERVYQNDLTALTSAKSLNFLHRFGKIAVFELQ